MKRALAMILVLGLALGLVGCSSAPAKAPATPPATAPAPIKMGKVDFAAHGTKCFTVAVVAVSGDKIVGAKLDEYQFMSKDVAKGVPNSDADFGKNFPQNMVLGSKMANANYYSENMKKNAGSKVPIEKSFAAIEAFVVGKTVAELEALVAKNSPEQMVDAVTGATLVDTKGYVSALIAAAKAAK